MAYKLTDTNGTVAAYLRDFALVQSSRPAMFGFKRAASTILDLDDPIESYMEEDGSMRRIPNIGPKSERIVREVLTTGSSATVERAIDASDKRDDIARRRKLREHFLSRAQVKAALNNPDLSGPAVKDYRGDFQMHSEWSDGTQTLEDIVNGGLARGYEYSAVTDHSYGLKIAGGVSMEDFAKQHREIDKLNRKYDGRFRLFKGVEANIRTDGSIDMTADELDRMELVVAAPHSILRKEHDQTERMLVAVSTRGVHILGHPRGRIYGSRPGVNAKWEEVFAAAKANDVAIEIDGDPSRQDLDYSLAHLAVETGCLFALDSDAHAVPDLAYAETAIAHARLAGVPADRIINCWPKDQLIRWLHDRKNS